MDGELFWAMVRFSPYIFTSPYWQMSADMMVRSVSLETVADSKYQSTRERRIFHCWIEVAWEGGHEGGMRGIKLFVIHILLFLRSWILDTIRKGYLTLPPFTCFLSFPCQFSPFPLPRIICLSLCLSLFIPPNHFSCICTLPQSVTNTNIFPILSLTKTYLFYLIKPKGRSLPL